MSKEVSINIELFRANIKKLEDSLTRLESGMKKNSAFDYTNITPFINDLKHLVQADKLLEQYKTLLDADIRTLQRTGESMKEHDDRLAQTHHRAAGPQLMK